MDVGFLLPLSALSLRGRASLVSAMMLGFAFDQASHQTLLQTYTAWMLSKTKTAACC